MLRGYRGGGSGYAKRRSFSNSGSVRTGTPSSLALSYLEPGRRLLLRSRFFAYGAGDFGAVLHYLLGGFFAAAVGEGSGEDEGFAGEPAAGNRNSSGAEAEGKRGEV